MRLLATITASAILGFSTLAAAQESSIQPSVSSVPISAKCTCTIATAAGNRATIATLSDVSGRVLLADSAGYTTVDKTAQLTVGDRVVLLSGGTAMLSAGAMCQARLVSQSMLSVEPVDGGACISISDLAVPTPTADLPVPSPEVFEEPAPSFLPVLFGAALVGGTIAAIVVLTDDDDDRRPRPVSP